MPSIKKHTTPKKGKGVSFTKKKIKSPSFGEKIEKANELLSTTVFLKKVKPAIVH
ncbi:MAG: hypothetical protein V4539_03835 [Bacteroidota bacterium]